MDARFRCATKPPLDDFPRLQLFLMSCLIAQHDIRYHNLLLIEIDHRVEHLSLMQALQIC